MRKSQPRPLASRFYFLAVSLVALAAGVLSLIRPDPSLTTVALVLSAYALHVAGLRQAVRVATRAAEGETAGGRAQTASARSGFSARAAARQRTQGGTRRERAPAGARHPVHPTGEEVSPAVRRSREARPWWRSDPTGQGG